MPWRETSVETERIAFVKASQEIGMGRFSGLCRAYGISRPTGYLWVKRVLSGGWVMESVEDCSRRPHRSPYRTSAEIESRVVSWRRREGWGGKKIREKLLAEGLRLPVITINRILKRHGLVPDLDRQAAAVRRFERGAPNELLQMDFKGDYRIRTGRCHPLSILDDHSRYALGLYALPNQGGPGVQRCLIEVFEKYGVPEGILMDHGSPWWSATNGFGLTWVGVWLMKQGISLHNGRTNHPQTQGKVERFHRTLKDSLRHHGEPETLPGFQEALRRFQRVYNDERPHEALGMDVPSQHYRPSRRVYQPNPPAWEYPTGALVKRLNSQGVLDCPGGRRFVCEALANEWVAIEEIEGHWLVKYRHQYVREIDLETGRTLPPVRPVSRFQD
jgi:transposase InsO family protein